MYAGTCPDRCISKPLSRMCQVINPSVSGITAVLNLSSASPAGVAETSAALAPSAKIRKLNIFSICHCSCRCRLHSSKFTTSTFAAGSERTMWRASCNAFTAAKQPMKPTIVRSTDGAQPGVVHDVQIETRRGEAGAACDDQMGDRIAVHLQLGGGDRLGGQRPGLRLEPRHARAGRGEGAAAIEPVAVQPAVLRSGAGREDGEAVPDIGHGGHPGEQRLAALIRQQRLAEFDAGGVNVVRRRCGADPVQPGLGHRGTLIGGDMGRVPGLSSAGPETACHELAAGR